MDVLKEVRKVRKEFGYSQKQMGDHLGISESQVRNIEKGRCKLTLGYLNELARLTGKKLIVVFVDD